MKKIFFASWLFALSASFAFGQDSLTVRGKIVDATTLQSIGHAAVHIGDAAGSTDDNGLFTIRTTKENIQKSGLTFAAADYKPQTIWEATSDNFLYITLFKAAVQHNLPDVVVSSGARDLVRRTILKIPTNYYSSPINTYCLQQSTIIVDDSAYQYKDFALLKLYLSSYSGKKTTSNVQLLQNRKTIHDFDASTADEDRVKWPLVGIYNLSYSMDFVFEKYSPIDTLRWDRYQYDLNGKTVYDGRTVLLVAYKDIDTTKDGFVGTIMIDSATLAIVNINQVTNAGLRKTMSKRNQANDFFRQDQIAYKWDGQKWVLKNVHVEGYILRDFKNILRSFKKKQHELKFQTDIVTTQIVNSNAQDIPFLDRVLTFRRLDSFDKPAPESGWAETERFMQSEQFQKDFPWIKL